MNTENVQGTNDSSIVSKLSMVNKGYFHDPFIKHFVEKSSKRSPLINRCYFARAAAISHCVEHFLKGCHGEKQIVSLGAGFDTTYFRMVEKGLLNDTYFIEVDFPDVMRRKIALARKGNLSALSTEDPPKHMECVYHRTTGYVSIGFDLQHVGPKFNKVLCDVGVSMDKPTLFLSEVVLTYLPSKKSSKVIKWASDTFEHAIFTVFEQVTPSDSFGKVMIRHFNQIGSPLLGIHDYPTIADHVKRHQECGLTTTAATTLCRFYYNCIDDETRERIERLEVFDEFEAWHRACQHYVVLCSTNSKDVHLKNLVTSMFGDFSQSKTSSLPTLNEVKVTYHGEKSIGTCIQRYGQCCCVKEMAGRQYAVVVGGFGVAHSNKTHQRLDGNIVVVDLESYKIHHCKRSENSSTMPYPMYASAVCSKDGEIYVFGGRSSPHKSTNSITKVCVELSSCGRCTYHSALVSPKNGDLPKPRWRHSAVLLPKFDETESAGMIIFGGRDATCVFNDWWSYCISNNHWRKIETSIEISKRHSSSLSATGERTCFLYGGLSHDEIPLGDLFVVNFSGINCISAQITRITIPLLSTQIYSHSSVFHGGNLIVCGGVTFYPHTQHGDEGTSDVVNIISPARQEHSRVFVRHSSPVLMHGHSCVKSLTEDEIIVLGGGDNCFSFGTCFVRAPMSFKLS